MNEEQLQMLEELFKSMSTITQQELNAVQFDRTVIAKIVKRYEDSGTKYLVSTDSLKFDAYSQSDSTRYAEGSSVYILIPDGDYSNNKLILGKYGEEDSSSRLLFTSPLDQIVSTQKLSYNTPKTLEVNSDTQVSAIELVAFETPNITKNGIKDIDTICLDFSLTTQGLENSTIGEYYISLDFCDSNENSLLNSELRTLLTIYSSQLNGNPYDLMQGIRFQFAFPFPLIGGDYAFTDLTKVKYVKVYLASDNTFDAIDDNDASITLNNISIYMGITGEVMSQVQNTISLNLDNTDSKEYETDADIKEMSIDWFRSDNNIIYSEVEGYQYPEADEYYIYWLQYSASDAYTKDLAKDDIEESGTYWKTVQKQDASIASAYTYTANNLDYKRYEEVFKVGIRSKDGTSYIESTPITFTNKSYDKTIGSNTGVPDTLTLTLSDSGVYNNYGIDNKLLGSNTNRTVTVTYVNNAITWQNQGPCTITWEIPAVATMIQIPKVKDQNGNYIEDSRWKNKGDVYQYTIKDPADTTGETISYQLQQQFGFNKTNNKIKCTITRYEDKEHKRPIDTYNGSIILQFGTQGTSGSEYAFNIRPRRPGALTGTKSITFDATLETNDGSPVTFEGTKVKWSVMQGDKEADLKNGNNAITGTTIEISNNTVYPKDYNKYYSILVATLSGFTDTNGKTINLKAYYPIPYSKSEEAANYYISGASRIVYNYQGTSPNYDSTPYRLYDENGDEVSVAQWSIRFPGWSEEDNYTDKNKTIPNGNWQNYPSLETVKVDGKEEYKLKPLSNIQSNILACNVTAYKKTIGATDSEEDRTNAILWAQPLLIIRNNYAFPLINSWDGNLTIDEEGNYILTELIGAGTKNKDNKYTGVLMGSIGKTGGSATTGLYGFNTGELRYKLDEKGNFYVGTGDDNKIDFDAVAKIMSIKTNNFILNTEDLIIDSTAIGDDYAIKFKDKFYVTAKGTAKIGGWNIESNYIDCIRNGGRIYLNASPSGDYFIWAGSDTNIDGKFYIDTDGKLYAQEAEISGKITATDLVLTGTATVEAAKIKGEIDGKQIKANSITADQIEADALTVDSISANKITNGSTNATIGFTGSVTISKDLTVSGTGTIGGIKLSSSSLSASGFGSSTALPLYSTFNATMIYSSNQVEVSDYGSGWYNRVYYISHNGKVSMSGSSSDEFYIMNTIPKNEGTYNVSKRTKGSISTEVSTGQYLIHNTSSSATKTASLSPLRGFSISSNGTLTASNATISGELTASEGLIGGWTIGNDNLHSSNEVEIIYQLPSNIQGPPSKKTHAQVTSLSANGVVTHVYETFAHANPMFTVSANWAQIAQVASSTIITSDERLKYDILSLSDNYEKFYDNLHPKRFKLYDISHTPRYHTGFIAQEVVAGLLASELTTNDFAAACLQGYRGDIEEDTGGFWFLRYDEFVALNTWQIQKLKARVTELEKEIKEIKQNEI